MDTIGERITKARTRLNLNQKELCKKTGISESTLSRFESGMREPRSSTLMILADTLDVSCDYLMGITDTEEYIKKCDQNKIEKDVYKALEKTLDQEGMMLYGQPVTKEELNKLRELLKLGVSMITLKK